MIKFFQLEALGGIVSGPAQTDYVQTGDAIFSAGDGERREVFADGGAAAHDGEGADAAELVDEAVAGNEGAVLNEDVAGEQGAVGKNGVVADGAIVGDVGVGHEEIMGTDAGDFAGFSGPMNGGVLAEDVVITNDDAGGFVAILEVLGGIADDATGVKTVGAADLSLAGQIDMGADVAIGSNFDAGVNDGEGANVHGRVQTGLRVNDGGRMNHFPTGSHSCARIQTEFIGGGDDRHKLALSCAGFVVRMIG